MSKVNVSNGRVVYVGPSQLDGEPIFAVLTGIVRPSANDKTGDMLQLWVLPRDTHPVHARMNDNDSAFCGSCPIKSACYVEWGKAPSQVWKTFHNGGYPAFNARRLADRRLIQGRKVRLGACGEPTSLPYRLCKQLASYSSGWTGYTHTWRSLPVDSRWSRLLMASVETAQAAALAQSRGWRTFRVSKPGSDQLDNEFSCPASQEAGFRSTCAKCLLCKGRSTTARNVTIWAHGSKAKMAALLPLLEGGVA